MLSPGSIPLERHGSQKFLFGLLRGEGSSSVATSGLDRTVDPAYWEPQNSLPILSESWWRISETVKDAVYWSEEVEESVLPLPVIDAWSLRSQRSIVICDNHLQLYSLYSRRVSELSNSLCGGSSTWFPSALGKNVLSTGRNREQPIVWPAAVQGLESSRPLVRLSLLAGMGAGAHQVDR